MRLAIVLERPTQFDVPLFRHAARDGEHAVRVLYTDARAATGSFDRELGRTVEWGEDLLAGYDCAIAPARQSEPWLRGELAARRELVVVNGYTRRPYLWANAAARRAGTPTALRLDSVLFDEGTAARRLAKRLFFHLVVRRWFRLFLGVGSSTVEYLQELGIPTDRTGLFPYPVDIDALRGRAAIGTSAREAGRAGFGISGPAPVVLAVAKLHPRETPWDLLHAWQRAAPPDRWLLIAGDGPDRAEVEAFVAARSLPRVRLLGFVPYPQLPALYALADLFVHAPREERWGVSVGEALASGRAVIASDRVGAARDLLREGQNGFIYEAGDAEALAARIDQALRLPARAVHAANEAILPSWGLAATWRSLLAAAARVNPP